MPMEYQIIDRIITLTVLRLGHELNFTDISYNTIVQYYIDDFCILLHTMSNEH